jgi:hypothetical protein
MTEEEKRKEEILKKFKLLRNKQKKADKLNKFFTISSYTGLAITTIILFISIFVNKNISIDQKYFDKSIKTELTTVIKHNGDISVIKNIFKNRKLKKPSLSELFSKKSDEDKYNSETILSEILNDLKSDYYLKNKIDTIYLKNLNEIIETQSLINPFDKLEVNQKNDFENLKSKLGGDYIKIHSDINRISDELNNKNQLVNKYLNKSNFSFLISIIALIITIFLSLYQIYQNRKSRTYSIIKEILTDFNPEDESEETTSEK